MKKTVIIAGSFILALSAATVFAVGGSVSSLPIDSQPTQVMARQESPGKIVNLALMTANDVGNDIQYAETEAEPLNYYETNVKEKLDNTQLVQTTLSQSDTVNIVNLAATTASSANNDIQYVEAKLGSFAYPEIKVEVGRPVKINFKVAAEDLNACNDEILIPEWNIRKKLSVGDNFVEFTPTKTGTFKYTCWMDMIQSRIIVTDTSDVPNPVVQQAQPEATQINEQETAQLEATQTNEQKAAQLIQQEMSKINQQVEPKNSDVLAAVNNTVTTVENNLTTIEAKIAPGGYPQLVVEVNKPVRINFKAEAADLNSCNNEIVIPEWNIRKPLSAGDNFVEFTPTKAGTYNYSCWMGMIRSSITVIEQGSGEIGALPLPESANTPSGCAMSSGFGGMGNGLSGGCCGGR